MKLPPPVPQIPVGDLERAILFYQNRLGFTLDWKQKPWGLYEFIAEDCDGNSYRVFHDTETPKRNEPVTHGRTSSSG